MMKAQFNSVFFLILLVVLSGCKTELYGGLSQQEGNEMYAILKSNGYDVKMEIIGTGSEQTVRLSMPNQQVAQAISLLQRQGYPKQKYDTMGDVFAKEGLISSPTEERARFIYAVSQELSNTLSNIDGVLIARVHVVMQEDDQFDKDPEPSTASVFIKYAEGTPVETLTPKIKSLVSNGILGLEYDQVSVALFPSMFKRMSPPSQLGYFDSPSTLIASAVLFAVILAAFVFLGIRNDWFQKFKKK